MKTPDKTNPRFYFPPKVLDKGVILTAYDANGKRVRVRVEGINTVQAAGLAEPAKALERQLDKAQTRVHASTLTVPIRLLDEWRKEGTLVGFETDPTGPTELPLVESWLVQSVLLGIPVLSLLVLENVKGHWIVLEGTEALRAVFRFLDGWRVGDASVTPALEGLTFEDLALRSRTTFLHFQVPVRSVNTDWGRVDRFLRGAPEAAPAEGLEPDGRDKT